MLGLVSRMLCVVLNVFFGLLPSAMFFLWVERNCTLPFSLGRELSWPLVHGEGAQEAFLAVWDLGLFLIFGLIHSLTAQRSFYAVLERFFPVQAGRTLYLVITGFAVTLLMSFWQPTGVLLFALPLPQNTATLLSLVLYFGFFSVPLRIMKRFDGLEFLGLRQIYQTRQRVKAPPKAIALQTTGIFARVRHPIYLFTLLAFLVTPVFSLDRGLVLVATLIYLSWGIPLEERKLIRIYGNSYRDYRARVPALIPRISFSIRGVRSRIGQR